MDAKETRWDAVDWIRLAEVKKVKFTLEQAMTAQRGSRGIAILFL